MLIQSIPHSHFGGRILSMLRGHPRRVAMATSLLLSLIAITGTLINFDGILYIRAAKAFSLHGFHAAREVYTWPFYSVIVGTLHQASGLSFEHIAYGLNASLLTITIGLFITLIRIMGGSLNRQWLAVAVVLAFPKLNQYRDVIIRDFGYWALLLLSLYYFIQFIKHPTWLASLYWNACIIIATLFRPEALVLWLAAPLVSLLHRPLANANTTAQTPPLFWRLALPPIALLLCGLFIASLVFNGHSLLNAMPPSFHWHNPDQVTFLNSAYSIAHSLSGYLTEENAVVMLAAALFAYLLQKIIFTLSPFFFLLASITVVKHLIPKEPAVRTAIVVYAIVTLLSPVLFLYRYYFLSARYVMPFCFIALLLVPQGIATLFAFAKNPKTTFAYKRWISPVLTASFIVLFFSGFLSMGYSKHYISEASDWLKTHVPSQKRLYTNNPRVAYYSALEHIAWDPIYFQGHHLKKILLGDDNEHFDYYAFVIKKKNPKLKQVMLNHFTQLQASFKNKRGDGVYIFKANDTAK